MLLEREGDGFGVVDGDKEWERDSGCCLLWSAGECAAGVGEVICTCISEFCGAKEVGNIRARLLN